MWVILRRLSTIALTPIGDPTHKLASAHPSVVFLYRVIADKDSPYITMDHCENDDLYIAMKAFAIELSPSKRLFPDFSKPPFASALDAMQKGTVQRYETVQVDGTFVWVDSMCFQLKGSKLKTRRGGRRVTIASVQKREKEDSRKEVQIEFPQQFLLVDHTRGFFFRIVSSISSCSFSSYTAERRGRDKSGGGG